MAFRKNNITIELFHQPYMHVVIVVILFIALLCYFASTFHVLTRFRAATFMLQTFQTTSKVLLGRGSILSDAVGVDGPIYLLSLPLLSF